tara:strand:- start:235 stop:579 length:345 start_codon:yes stop_codon:yes gene_type:complete
MNTTFKFKNIYEAHKYFRFPGSYRVGAIINNDLVVRIYSNSLSRPDFFSINKKYFYYVIKNSRIYEAFKKNKSNNTSVHVFTKNLEEDNVVNHGLYKVKGFRKNKKYVLLEKIN